MIRHATPLRYPGGKQRLAPFISEIIRASDLANGHYVEPYAGGAGVAINLLLSGIVSKIHLNDFCKPVHAFWRSILLKTDEFCRRISSASLTVEEWQRQRAVLRSRNANQLDLGFSFFYLNRCNRSGIPSAGLIGGLDQSGDWKMDARFPRNELIHRIEAIAAKKECISLKNWDAEIYLRDYCSQLPKNALIYCDPPYFRKADRLYLNHYKEADHVRIASLIQKSVTLPWVVSYDNSPQILKLYSKRRHFLYDLQYNVATVYKGKEVFFFSDKIEMPSTSSVPSINMALVKMSKGRQCTNSKAKANVREERVPKRRRLGTTAR